MSEPTIDNIVLSQSSGEFDFSRDSEVDIMLDRLGFDFKVADLKAGILPGDDANVRMQKQLDASVVRHCVTEAATAHLYGAQRLVAMDYERSNDELQEAREEVRTFLTFEVTEAHSAQDAAFISYHLKNVLDADTSLEPTFNYIIPEVVRLIEDDALALQFLERSLPSWSPVIDREALERFGMDTVDTPFEVTDSRGNLHYPVHNADIGTLIYWAERFPGTSIANFANNKLEYIAEEVALLTRLEFRSLDVIEALRHQQASVQVQ